jgi:hypothetical protein
MCEEPFALQFAIPRSTPLISPTYRTIAVSAVVHQVPRSLSNPSPSGDVP